MTIEEISKNQVKTINQYKVLQYLKNNLNIYCFRLTLEDKDTIKVVDILGATGYFKYNEITNDVDFIEN